MALTACHECKAKISTEAKSCPQCGAPVAQPMSRWKIGVLGFLGIAFAMSIADSWQQSDRRRAKEAELAALTPEQRAYREQVEQRAAEAKKRDEAEFQRVVRFLHVLKLAAKNPATFSVDAVILMPDRHVCVEARGTNSFNAVVPSFAILTPGEQIINALDANGQAQWQKHCAGRSGQRLTHARLAM